MKLLEALRQTWHPQPPAQLTISSALIALEQGQNHADYRSLAGRVRQVAQEVAGERHSQNWNASLTRLLDQQLALLLEIAEALETPEPWRLFANYRRASQDLQEVQEALERFGQLCPTCPRCGFEGEHCDECGLQGLLLDDQDLEESQQAHWLEGPIFELYLDLCSIFGGHDCLSCLQPRLQQIAELLDQLEYQSGAPELGAMWEAMELLEAGLDERRLSSLAKGWKRLLDATAHLQVWQETQQN
ncbi:MAG: hypothetical protein U0931_38595 [Vulcanimicrobiota bacterium]